jgi:hypothetical protein
LKLNHYLPFHGGATLHSKIVKHALEQIELAASTPAPEE